MCDAGSWIWWRQLVLRTEADDTPDSFYDACDGEY
jgi:hypothetical protein